MLIHRTTLATLIVLASGIASAAAFAADSPFYIGASAGLRTNYGLDCNGASSCDLHSNKSGKLYAGYEFEAHQFAGYPAVSAVEVMAYAADSANAGFHTATGIAQGAGKFNGVGVGLRSATTINNFSIITRVGLGHSIGKVNYAAGGSDSKSSNGLLLGLGAAYALDKNWSLHADLDYFPKAKFSENQSSRVNMFSLGASYHF